MTPDPETRREGDTIDGSLMMQYLLAMLANRPGRGGLNDAFGGLMGMPGGAENGQFGDYVFNQEALDQIISQIMENSNGHAPVPATEEVMNNLPRTILEEGCTVTRSPQAPDTDWMLLSSGSTREGLCGMQRTIQT